MSTLRPARTEGAARLALVHLQSWRETCAGLLPDALLDSMTGEAMRGRRETQWISDVRDAAQVIRVVEMGGEVVAFASGRPLRAHPAIPAEYTAEPYTLYALKGAHGLGLGRRLFAAVLEGLREQGHRSPALWVLSANPARRFYLHLGGRELGEKVEVTRHGELRETALGWADTGTGGG